LQLKKTLDVFGGLDMRIVIRVSVLIAFLLGSSVAYSQAVDVTLGLNSPLKSNQVLGEGNVPIESDFPLLSLGFFSGNYRGNETKSRYGLLVGYRSATAVFTPQFLTTRSFSELSFQFKLGRNVHSWKSGTLSVDLGLGLSVFSDRSESGDPDSSWPDSELALLASPEVNLAVPLRPNLSGMFGLRGLLYISDLDESNPFESGVVVTIGLQFGENQ
jgi:hypothetical protein